MSADLAHAVSDETAHDLLVDLVSTPSPSGEEAAAADRLVAFFETCDREVWIDDVGNVRAPADDSVLLTSHVDTVPGEIPVRVETVEEAGTDEPVDVLWGRGSVDATGPLAAMAVAAVRTGVSFAGVVGEETDSRGARHLVADRVEPAAVINGEPSGTDGITLGYRGLLAGTYTVSTASRHSSRPEPNAIQRAMTWWAAVETALASACSDDAGASDERSVFEQVTAKPVAVDGATSDDGLAVEATIAFQLRIPPAVSTDSVRERVRASTETHGGDVAWTDAIPPVMASPRTPVARAFRAAIRAEGGEPRLLRKTGTSDMNVFADRWSCPMATYGPGDASLDHTPDEHLPLAAFDRSIAVLERVATTLVPDAAGRKRTAASGDVTGDDAGERTDGGAAVTTESTASHAEPPHGGDTQ